MSVTTAYLLLAGSIFFEMIAAGSMPATKGFTVLKPSLVCIVCYTVCFFFFGISLEKIDLSIGYATWGAVGTVVTTLIGILLYKQKVTKIGAAALCLIVLCIFCLNFLG